MKSTGGPWNAAPTGDRMRQHYSQGWGIASLSERTLVAGVFSDCKGGEEAAEANARLIAAAPDLLAAVKVALEQGVTLANSEVLIAAWRKAEGW